MFKKSYDELRDRALSAGTPEERSDILERVARLYASLLDESGAEQERSSLLNNFPRLLRAKPADVERLALKYLPVEHFSSKLRSLEQRFVHGTDVDACYADFVRLRTDFEAWYAAADRRERKRANVVRGELGGRFARLALNASLYGVPPKLEWGFEVRSADDARVVVSAALSKLEEGTRVGLDYLVNPKSSDRPPYFLFLVGRNGASRFDVIETKPFDVMMSDGLLNVRVPLLRCENFEQQFAGLGRFEDSYLRELVSFIRGESFREVTGYKNLVLVGIERKIDSAQLDELKLNSLPRVRSCGSWHQWYGVNIEEPGKLFRPGEWVEHKHDAVFASIKARGRKS